MDFAFSWDPIVHNKIVLDSTGPPESSWNQWNSDVFELELYWIGLELDWIGMDWIGLELTWNLNWN